MEPINILVFILSSFFGVKHGHFAANKTTVMVSPEKQEIIITQEQLFAFIESKQDTATVLSQWDQLVNYKKRKTAWSAALARFSSKALTFEQNGKHLKAHIKLKYTNPQALQTVGISFDQNTYTVFNMPHFNIKSKDGKLVNQHWTFDTKGTFKYTLEPFKELPRYLQEKQYAIEDLLQKKRTQNR